MPPDIFQDPDYMYKPVTFNMIRNFNEFRRIFFVNFNNILKVGHIFGLRSCDKNYVKCDKTKEIIF